MFNRFDLDSVILKNVEARGYRTPTRVQRGAIPHALEGSDLIVTAETGSGKTAAFALPLINRLLKMPRGKLHAVVLCPTREVAQQTAREVKLLSAGTRLRSLAVYGGTAITPQIKTLLSGVEIVVATPGRLLDHVNRNSVKLGDVTCVVLDEADRMLDMGFLPDVSRILNATSRNRQTMLFSATMPKEVLTLSNRFMREPIRVSQYAEPKPPETLSHGVYPAKQQDKTRLLLGLLRKERLDGVLVFARTKRRAEQVAKQLARAGLRAACIHGGRSQRQRDEALGGFSSGRYRVLVGTDVASRGIDVAGVNYVVNYDFPAEPDSYIHRVGRTARAGRTGTALSLVTTEDTKVLQDIEHLLGCRIPIYEMSSI